MTATVAPPTSTPRRERPRARWVLPATPDPARVAHLAEELKLPEIVCRLLLARGHEAPDSAKRYLRPRLEQLHDPLAMLDLEKAAERLARAVREGETVFVHGDYDVDGISSTTLLVRALRGFGGVAVPFIPRRLQDGYDLTEAGVRAAIAAGARVVVTCDCGTSALEPVKQLCAAGIDVIVSDHHLPGGPLPECLAVLNPRRPGCDYPDKDLAAVGVAFKLALAVARKFGANEAPIFGMLDLVALATVADIAPLRGENRILVRYGLKMLAETRNVGLRALIRAAGLDGKPMTAGRIGFILAPRLNAVGRLGHAIRGVELLTSDDEHRANVIARELEELNRERQAIDRATLEQAREMAARLDLETTYGIVLAREGWHPGVIGIVASKLVEEFGRPVLLIALDGEDGKGSGRSISAFDLHAGLGECRHLMVRFGGHRMAAGVTVRADRVEELARCFNDVARARLTPNDLVPEVRIDLEVPMEEVTDDLESLLRHFEPFGIGNPSPTLVVRGARLAAPPRTVKGDALKLRLVTPRGELDAIGWGLARLAPTIDASRPVDVAFRLERDEWNGQSRLQARLVDVRHA